MLLALRGVGGGPLSRRIALRNVHLNGPLPNYPNEQIQNLSFLLQIVFQLKLFL